MKIINTALCSFGMSGCVFHAPFINVHPSFKLKGAWERSKKLIQQKYPDAVSYSSYEELLADKDVDLVVVNTPNYTHYEYAKLALQAGKDIIVEKPFTITAEEAKELIAIADKENKLISVFQSRRYDSDFRTVKKVVQQNLLGEIVEAEIHYDRFNEALSPKQHKEIPGPGTGILYDLGSHLIDQALQLFGMPQAVFADLGIVRPISLVEDYMEVLLYYPNIRVRLKGTYLAREIFPSYVLHGSKGSFLKSRADIQEANLQALVSPADANWGVEPETEQGILHTEKEGKIIREHVPTEKGNYVDYYEGVYQALIHKTQPPVSAQDGLNVIKVIEAAYKSNNEKCVAPL
ncbi:Gfo/Idh/MocA family oxidoreductase [Ferruginibacter albus]|uniref:Gfo/Idh/MocA family oxidoreductase n=1 Tax=Ferruginibacter albus TaxID=2875540 RepID=UPI001CC6E67E|nr:Gfo/Idh/MocA family oxidoreductase [Ferruginibacter albus]UAY53656.1 Gfo/Idh/MocA family oxidoreductase [Ferruginibacter albus]